MYPRFSPDGKWIAFSSNRYGNNDVFVVPAGGGATQRLTFHPGADDVVGWTRDSTKVLIRPARGAGAFPNVATLWEVPVGGGPEQPLPVDWGYYGSYSPDGKSLAFNRHPATWTRQHYRGSFAADLWIANLAAKTYTQLLPDERYNRYWPMWGADNAIYFVADPLPNDRTVVPGQPRGPQERQQHLQDSGERRPARAGHASPRRQPVLAVDVERRQSDRLRIDVRPLEARRRDRQDRARSASRSPPTTRTTRPMSKSSATKSTRSICRRRAAAR